MAKAELTIPDIASRDDVLEFLRHDLNWPIPDDAVSDELTFEWDNVDIKLSESESAKLKDGVIQQVRPLVPGQPWVDISD